MLVTLVFRNKGLPDTILRITKTRTEWFLNDYKVTQTRDFLQGFRKVLDVILPEDDHRRLYNDEVNLGVLEETLIEMKGGDLSNIPRPIVITVNGNGGISIVDA